MSDSFAFALAGLTTLILAGLDLAVRSVQRDRERSWALSFIGSAAGALVLAPICLRSVPEFDYMDGALLMLQGALWGFAVYLEMRSSATLEAGLGALISSLRTAVLAGIGVVAFGEVMTLWRGVGGMVVIVGALCAVPRALWRSEAEGVLGRILAALVGAAAITTDKILITRVGLPWTVVMSYLTPAILFMFFRPSNWRVQLEQFSPASFRTFWLAVVLYVLVGPVMIAALGFGELSATFMITQSRIVLVALGGVLILKECAGRASLWLWVAVTVIGVAMVVGTSP